MAENEVGVRVKATDEASGPIGEISEKLQEMVDRVTSAQGAFSKTQAAIISFNQAMQLLNELGEKAKQIYEATAGAVIEFAESVEQLNNTAQALGLTAQQLHNLDDAAKLLGVSGDQFNHLLLIMERQLNAAGNAASPVGIALRAIGVDIADLRNLKPDEQFETVAYALGQMQDPMERAHAGTLIFARGWQQLIPLMKDGGLAFGEARERASQLGYTIDQELVDKSEHLIAATRELDVAWGHLSVTLKELFMPALTSIVQTIERLIQSFKWMKANNYYGPGSEMGTGLQSVGSSGSYESEGGEGNTAGRPHPQLNLPSTLSDSDVWNYVNSYITGRINQVDTSIQRSFEAKILDIGGAQGGERSVGQNLADLIPGYSGGDKRAEQMRGVGIDPNMLAGKLSETTGLGITPEMLGGAMGVFMNLLMQNPLFQADMKRLMDVIEELITPLVEAIGPALDELVPLLHDMKPIFELVGEVLHIYLAPLVTEMHILNQIIKPLADAIEGLKNEIEKIGSGGGLFSGGGGGIGGAIGGAVASVGHALGFADGGMITPDRMLSPVGPDGGGLVYAHVGETVVPQGGGNTVNIHIHALDPRATADPVRRVIQELQAAGRL